MRYLLILLCGLIAFSLPAAAQSERRVALVIGNSAYRHTTALKNPRNDAIRVAAILRELKFQVVEGVDLGKADLEAKIREFSRALVGAEVGLFFYAGHGIQVAGQNYVVPVDALLEDGTALNFELIRLDFVQQIMEQSTRTNIIFLDACRDNPLARNLARALGTRSTQIGHGLAPMESGSGTLISFSTQPGNVALDGEGANSPYAAALTKHIKAQGEDLSSILINVRNDVMAATNERQVPWDHSALRAKFYFGQRSAPSAPVAGQSFDQQAELVFWNGVKDSRSPAMLQTYLDRFPNGVFAGLAAVMIEHLTKEEAARASLAQREAEAKRAEQAKAPVAGGATQGREAEERRRQAELERLQQEVRKAQEALKAAEAEREGVLKAAQEAHKLAQAARIASVQGEQGQAKPSQPSPPDPAILARALQQELKRVGCDPGATDGKWGPRAQEALSEFVRVTKLSLPVDQPSDAALQAVTGQRGRVCALACGPSETNVGGKCVAKSKPEPSKSRTTRAAPDRNERPAKGMPETPKGTTCWGYAPTLQLLPCSDPRAMRKAF